MTHTLSPRALDFLWEALGAGELPYPLEARSHGLTMDERAALRRQTHEELRGAGLLDRSGRVERRIEDDLVLLARADVSIDSVFLPELDAEPVLSYAAMSRAAAVIAVQAGEGLRLTPIRPGGLVADMVAMLPPAPRGTEPSISLPAADVAAATAFGSPRGAEAGRATAAETKQALARLAATPNLRGGQIAVNSRDQSGARRRSPVLSWFDKPSGRYIATMRRGRDGQDWVTVAPADAPTFRHRITELVNEVTGGPGQAR